MSRKGTNIYKRKDGRWEARYVKSIELDGKKKYASVYGSSYREARDKQVYCMNHLSLPSNSPKLSLTNLMWGWLFNVKNSVKKSTYQKYDSIIRNHIENNSIGNIQVRYLTSKNISDYTNQKFDSGTLSAKTINDILIVLGLALSYAEENYNISKPKINHIKENRKEMRVLSIEEQHILETFLCNNMDLYKFGVLLSLYTGIRVGELCALRWTDITNKTIVINKTLHRIKEGNKTILEVTEPKTETSNRKIPVPSFMNFYIDKYRSYGSVLKNRNGEVVEPRLMQLTFERYIEKCGLPKTNFHALRHTFATRCVEAGFDIKSLSEILGHTDVKTTLNKYVHSSYEQKQKNMELLKPITEL